MIFRRYAPIPGYEARHGFVRWAVAACFTLRAAFELARGRLAFARHAPAAFIRDNRRIAASGRLADAAWPGDALLVSQVTFVIPRIAHRVPWRADCLVQALAAQKWLETAGIASTIAIGAENSQTRGFNAHAWLKYGDRIVTGGEVDGYEVLLG